MRQKKPILIITSSILLLLLMAWFLPLPPELTSEPQVSTTRILDRNGKLLYDRRAGGFTLFLPLSQIPHDITSALTSTEDRTFWSNPGVSLRGTVRALVHDIQAGQFIEGGSTITQQYVRLRLRPAHRTLLYKICEAWLALKLTAHASKDQILESYLNEAYLGQQAYGISAASHTYFGKNVSELSLGESALLIGLLNAPTSLNPFRDPGAARERRDLVLRAMRATGSISSEQQANAQSEPIHLSHGRVSIIAPHFVMWLLGERGGEWRDRSEVRTTLDADLQSQAQQIVENQLDLLNDRNVTSAAVVVLDARTGDVLSMVGSRDYFDDAHDGAVNSALASRQPGSAIKPFTYALAQGMTAATTVPDVEANFLTGEGNPYTPRNYDYSYHGLVRLREALANSYNIAVIHVLEHVGVEKLLKFLQRVGLTTLTDSPNHYGLALTLGDSEVKLLELTRAYGIFARGGRTLELRTALDDAAGAGGQVLDSKVAWLIADILSDNDARAPEFGRDSALHFDFPVGAKTGTTRNSRDNWTIGFTPSRIVGVWVGNADNSPMRGTSGVTGAGPIFHWVMLAAMRGLPRESFLRPSGIVDQVICKISGKLMTAECPVSMTEHFIEGTVPTEHDDIYRSVAIDSRNGLLFGSGCDLRFRVKKIFTVFPPEVQAWARENGYVSPPTQYAQCGRDFSSNPAADSRTSTHWLTISSPHDGSSFLLDPLIPDSSEQLTLSASADPSVSSIEWRVNGQLIGTGKAPDFRVLWRPHPGTFKIGAKAADQSDHIRITIEK